MDVFPYGVVIILFCGLSFTIWTIYYILRLAYLEMQDEHHNTKGSDSESS